MEQRIFKMKNAKIREENGKKYLEGYFSVFNAAYEICDGWIEEIAPQAFKKYLSSGEDTKVLWNHDSNIVLGSTANNTASLTEDNIGLFGSVEINENDQEALNAYARVQRGDVDGCSFGFDIESCENWWDDNEVYHTRITGINPLYEVSPCTFPAYKATTINARNKEQIENIKKRYERAKHEKRELWKKEALKKLKGE